MAKECLSKMKKALFVATVTGHINAFHIPHLKSLKEKGYEIHVASLGNEKISYCDKHFNIPIQRLPWKFENITAYKELKKIINYNNYEIIHCHTPMGGCIARLAARKSRKNGTKVIYTAHGFHFFKGAPMLNWLIYYPIEKICSHFTDVLITINQEDYTFAKKKMHAKKICYVPGVGVDIDKFSNATVNKTAKRIELGINDDNIMLLSVGELNTNKNHEVIIKALAKLGDKNIHYFIAGRGDKKEHLENLAKELNVNLHLLGFRTDISELCKTADIFCFPSLREGLGLAAIEAMACGLPLVTSNVHGINDYSEDGKTGFKCDRTDENQFADAIKKLVDNYNMRVEMADYNIKLSKKYELNKIIETMEKIYGGVNNG